MGGTFNPIHVGHLLISEEALAAFSLDRVLFIPNSSPPHKNISDIVSGEHRINMIKHALVDKPKFRICTIESFGTGHKYTANTLKNLHELFSVFAVYL